MNKFQLEGVLKLVDVNINPQVFRRISQAVAGLPQALQQTAAGLQGASNQAANLNKRLQNSANSLSQNARAANLFLNRMAQFAILLPTFATLNRAIQGGVKFLFEFDSALRDIIRVDVKGLSGRIEEIGDAAIKTAVDFGVLTQEVLETTKVFVQAGLSIEDAQERAQLAILATQVSTLSSADAIEFFISASNQFQLSNEQLVNALDALVKVEDLAAVEAQDVAEAFRTGGNSLAEFGKDINDGIGLISALREQTRKSGREIGTFFKTLQTRIFAAGESRDAVEALGVTVENLDGTLRPTLDVLNDLKVAFDGLNEAQAATAAKAIGGVRQFESLIATLNSLDRANELSIAGSQAAGAADLKRTVTDEKLERQLGKLIAQGQAFAEALGDAGLEDTLSGALKVATGILGVFTKLVDVVSELGGNLTPLLALGGIQLGKSIFGLAGGGVPGGGGQAPKPGSKGFIGPSTPQQMADLGLASTGLKQIGNIAVETGKLVANFGNQVATNTTLSQAQGLQFNLNTQSLGMHTTAIRADLKAISSSVLSKSRLTEVFTSTSAGLAAITIAATFLPKAISALEEKALKLGGALGVATSNFVGILGAGATLGTQFAFLGKDAAKLAAGFGLAFEASKRLIAARDDELKAIEEISEFAKSAGRISGAETRIQGAGNFGEAALSELFNNLAKGVKGKSLGTDLSNAINDALNVSSTSDAFKDLGINSEELRTALLGNINVLGSFIKLQEDNIQNIADGAGRLDQFNALMDGLRGGTLNTSEAFGLLLRSLGAGEVEINNVTGLIKKAFDFKEFQDVQKIIDFADEIRSLGLELELARLGPKALADDLVRLETEFSLVQRSAAQAEKSLNEQLSAALDNLAGVNFAKGIDFPDLLKNLLNVPENFDQKSIDRFKEVIRGLPKVEREAGEELLKIVEAQTQVRLDLQKAENAALEEQQRRAKALLDVQTQATQNAFESTRKFTAELKKFGDAVDSNILQAFQSINTSDIEDTLSGNSKLDKGIQEIILGAFGDNKPGNQLAKSQTNLNAVSDDTQAKLDILAKKLEIVNNKLLDSDRSNEKAALTAEKLGIELDIEQAKQQGAIAATEAKIKVLEAERDVIKAAKEAEEKRQDLLNKLTDTTRQFNKELRDSERSFEDFSKQKLADLFKDEQEAQSNLKEVQQDVIASTTELADAYESLTQAQLEFGNAIAEAKLKSNLLARDIALLTGEISTFDGQLSAIGTAFNNVLNNANITLEKRISLEQQLAEETLSFLQRAQDDIVQAGVGVFGQTSTENQDLGQGIAGLQFVADQLGGSFESFLNLTQGELSSVTETLLNLPAEFRQQILSALSFLPSTTNIGGFNIDQLTQAIGQVGAGVAPEVGLPSIEELNTQQVEQLQKLQDLALQDAQLQYSQVVIAQEQIAKADEQLQASKILEQRAIENLSQVRDAVMEEAAFLDVANQERRELLNAVISADDRNTLSSIENEAQLFAEQNDVFRDVGENIVRGITSSISAKLATIEAANNVNNLVKGYIPNFAGGNLSPKEAAGLLNAASREKRMMPPGAGLAVANTSEAVIPMRYRGYVPNFQSGNLQSPIAAGIDAIRSINESVVAAIAQSVTKALSDLRTGGGTNSDDLLAEIIAQLNNLNDTIDEINVSNAAIQSNTVTTNTTTTSTATSAQDVRITLETNQNNNISVSGLENLRAEIVAAVKEAAADQVDEQLEVLLTQLDSVITSLQERGLINSLNLPR